MVWIESICNDEALLEANIKNTKLSSPDYVGVDPDTGMAVQSAWQNVHFVLIEAPAYRDFRARIANYEASYQTLSEEEGCCYIKFIDTGKMMVTYRIEGIICSRIVYFLLHVRINHAPIYITRHGESEFNIQGYWARAAWSVRQLNAL